MKIVGMFFVAVGLLVAGFGLGVAYENSDHNDPSWKAIAELGAARVHECVQALTEYVCDDPRTGPLKAANIGCKDWHSSDPALRAPAEVSHAI